MRNAMVAEGGNEWIESQYVGSGSCSRKRCCLRAPKVNLEAPWTTARAKRLLRPLTSRIAELRKSKQLGHQELNPSNVASENLFQNGTARGDRLLGSGSGSSIHDISSHGEEVPRRRLMRTYSTRIGGRRPRVHSDNAGQSNLNRDGRHILTEDRKIIEAQSVKKPWLLDTQEKLVHLLVNSNAIVQEVTINQSGTFDTPTYSRECYKQLVLEVVPSHRQMVSGLYEAMDALLKATPPDTDSRDGPRSLFETSLRQLPKFIAKEQLQADHDYPDDDYDMSSIIYNQLENLRISAKCGWRPMRHVVRAHGIQHISSAVKEGIIPIRIARALVVLLLQRKSYSEAQIITESMLDIMEPELAPETSDTLLFDDKAPIALLTLNLVATTSQSNGFKYAQLARLFDKGTLPIDWIACPEMKGCWSSVILSVTQGESDCPQAALLLKTVLALASSTPSQQDQEIHRSRVQHSKIQSEKRAFIEKMESGIECLSVKTKRQKLVRSAEKTISNILTVLSSASILRKPDNTILEEIGVKALKAVELKHHPLELALIAAALPRAYAIAKNPDALHDFPSTLESQFSSDLTFLVDDVLQAKAGAFICNVARCCGKAMSQSPFGFLQVLVQGLNSLHTQGSGSSPTRFWHVVARGAAFEYAESTGERKHLKWAAELDRQMKQLFQQHPAMLQTPAIYRMSDKTGSGWEGYRWEEGISEWVARTPASTLQGLQRDTREALGSVGIADEISIPVEGCSQAPKLDNVPNGSPCILKRKRSSCDKMDCSDTVADSEDLYSDADELCASPGRSCSSSARIKKLRRGSIPRRGRSMEAAARRHIQRAAVESETEENGGDGSEDELS